MRAWVRSCEVLPSVLGTVAGVSGLFSGLLDSFFDTISAIASSATGDSSTVLSASFEDPAVLSIPLVEVSLVESVPLAIKL